MDCNRSSSAHPRSVYLGMFLGVPAICLPSSTPSHHRWTLPLFACAPSRVFRYISRNPELRCGHEALNSTLTFASWDISIFTIIPCITISNSIWAPVYEGNPAGTSLLHLYCRSHCTCSGIRYWLCWWKFCLEKRFTMGINWLFPCVPLTSRLFFFASIADIDQSYTKLFSYIQVKFEPFVLFCSLGHCKWVQYDDLCNLGRCSTSASASLPIGRTYPAEHHHLIGRLRLYSTLPLWIFMARCCATYTLIFRCILRVGCSEW